MSASKKKCEESNLLLNSNMKPCKDSTSGLSILLLPRYAYTLHISALK